MASFSIQRFDPVYKDDEDKEKTRTIGLELECSIINPDCPEPDFDDYTEDDDYDSEYTDPEDEINDWINMRYTTTFPGIGQDGSGHEFVTNPESISYFLEGGSEDFKKKIQFLRENTRTYPADGTHIHVSVLPGEDKEYLAKKAAYITGVFAVPMQKIFGRISRWAAPSSENYFERKFRPDFDPRERTLHKILVPKNRDQIQRAEYGTKHAMISIKPKTIEFRAGKGSHAIAELLAWIQTAHNIVEIATKKEEEIDNVKLKEILTGEYIEKYLHYIQNNPRRVITEEELEECPNTIPMIQIVAGPREQTIIL